MKWTSSSSCAATRLPGSAGTSLCSAHCSRAMVRTTTLHSPFNGATFNWPNTGAASGCKTTLKSRMRSSRPRQPAASRTGTLRIRFPPKSCSGSGLHLRERTWLRESRVILYPAWSWTGFCRQPSAEAYAPNAAFGGIACPRPSDKFCFSRRSLRFNYCSCSSWRLGVLAVQFEF